MNKKLMITLTLMFLMCFGSVGQGLAQTRVPGVTFGTNVVYSITSSWASTNASATAPPFLVDTVNGTLAYNVTVTFIANDNVTDMVAWSFKNGTVINSIATINTDTGEVYEYVPNLAPFQGFYDANLQVNDPLYPGNLTLPFWINQTTTFDYASGKRDTNVVEFTYQVQNRDNVTGSETQTQYIDKATGILVELKIYSVFPDQTGTQLWMLASTNLWAVSAAPSELPLPLPVIVAIVAVIIVVAVAAFYFRSRRGRRKKFRR